MLVAAGRESDCCSSSIGSWSEPCRPNWWLRPSLEHFEGKEERNSSGGRQQQHSFSSPKASFGPSLCRRSRWWRWRAAVDPVWTAVTATASLLCCVSPPSLPRRRLAASVQPPAAPHYVLCQAPSYSMLLTDLPAVTISGFEASHNGRNIWVKIWYMLIFNFDFSCFYPLCLKLGQSSLIYVCTWNFMFMFYVVLCKKGLCSISKELAGNHEW